MYSRFLQIISTHSLLMHLNLDYIIPMYTQMSLFSSVAGLRTLRGYYYYSQLRCMQYETMDTYLVKLGFL